VTVEPAVSPAQIEAFIRFPFELYRDDPHWVPPLLLERRAFLDPRKNPVFEYADVQPFVARRGGRVAGVLLDAAAAWLSARGLSAMRGPVNLTTNDVLGLLVDGFDDDPAVMMPFNPRYYPRQFERLGLRKAKDLVACEITADGCEGRLDDLVEKLLSRGRCTTRPVDLKHFREELEFVRRCYNEAWKDNWGFVPWTDRELAFVAKELKPLVDPRLTFVGEIDGEPAGISISIPDVTEALKLTGGRLFPTGLLRILWTLKVRGCRRVRTAALGVLFAAVAGRAQRAIDVGLAAQPRFRKLTAAAAGWPAGVRPPRRRRAAAGRSTRTFRPSPPTGRALR
jgi:hypothetical protein